MTHENGHATTEQTTESISANQQRIRAAIAAAQSERVPGRPLIMLDEVLGITPDGMST